LSGFKPNTNNLNHLLFDNEAPEPTKAMKEKHTQQWLTNTSQNSVAMNAAKNKTFVEAMDIFLRSKYKKSIG
jgi:hypothetical protein